MTEDEVTNRLYSRLVTTLKGAKDNGLLSDAGLVSQDERWLVICGLALLLAYAARSETSVPNIALPCPEGSDWRLDASACPSGFRPYFDRWAGLVPRIRALSRDHVHDLALLICRKSPVTLPRELPDPFPFLPTPEEQAREDIRDLSSKLTTISNALSIHSSFSLLWPGKLCMALNEEIQPSTIPAVITIDMTLSEVISVLVRHSCPNIVRELDLASCLMHYVPRSGFGELYRGKLHDGAPVAIKILWSYSSHSRSGEFMVRRARGVYAWSKCHHPNVLPLISLAEFRGGFTTISPWMDNGNVRDYVNKQPGADRFNLCTQIACGLAYLHSVGIVHSDVKGDNVLVSDSGVPMLGGFSSSIPKESAIRFPKMEDKMYSSLRWAAPEILRGESTVSMVADVYAFGMVILEVFTGKVPYNNLKHEVSVVSIIMRNEIPQRPLEQIPSNDSQADMLWALMKSCWRRESGERPTAEQAYKTVSWLHLVMNLNLMREVIR
ncbi:hypothetical protein FRC12_000438 [Ceratobasidium sp. 428]|nr:hypothetical protein FRC12_000438 [Ceratobasidium sp. 428]